MRHANASMGAPTLADHERPLNPRGQLQVKALGHWLREKNLAPTQALVSSSLRTQTTFAGLSLDVEPTLKKDLYNSSSDILLENIENAQEDTLLLIAHNPGIGDLAFRLARMIGELPLHDDFGQFPSGSTLVVQWNADSWLNLDYSQGEILEFIVPQDLIPHSN